ncbi:pyruvate, water dikinase [Saccharolobus solfataricus]|uniref:Phosphoenolpyruvate synthase n=2 Tax=Saccharolobus solfataricus TaxID=2287 RepID=Q97ZL2_SACS2|nr:pyruvate, water dikinase [Saccharolobus solfataricus]AAK41168.1 Phosphoenolpyruvate synthase (ppsA-1) [Saccharolobus solfataricus P2]AKA74124.1 pyruvate, water dikinase [Saccharolobus solfataricus]AKA76822.1 pyruvate, water dikinase [Saccharolobus solfataricus]AKA79515.1 pyruvate, water dikinase [Saccharolobus solfataricus]AZF68602.1 pyruvate, water dikinase [Saccharolobus solfataricus]
MGSFLLVEAISSEEDLILDVSQVTKDMVQLAGGKGANLGELTSIGVRVPPAFILTSKAFKYFLEYNNLFDKIRDTLSSSETSEEASEKIKQLIKNAKMPDKLSSMIYQAYDELSKKVGKEILVAVRSSATAEDIETASFAGQQDTYLNVTKDELIDRIKDVWASLYNARAMEYRKSKGIDDLSILIAVVVQKMVNSRSAGVMFTLHPVTGDEKYIMIESNWGLGESVVGGKVTPDEVLIEKSTLRIVEKKVSNKNIKIVYDKQLKKNVTITLDEKESRLMSITDEEAIELAKLALKIEEHYKRPMDIEWAIDNDLSFPENIFIVQARPETFWSSKRKENKNIAEKSAPIGGKVLVRGLAASPGIAFGKAKIILDIKDPKVHEFQKGEILVTKMTDPDWVPLMKIAGAIITDEGGMTSHAAIVSRELGIPAIVGSREATKIIRDNQEITVDAIRGIVYEGKVLQTSETVSQQAQPSIGIQGISREVLLSLYPVTATKIYMNLGEPDVIDKYLDLPFDGIGLMRIEFIVSEWVRYHPLYLIKIGNAELFVDKLAEGIAKVASAIYPRPVVVRFSDFKTNEYKKLIGGEEFEPDERNPMIGWRGVSRYVSKEYEPAFRLEAKAIRKVREEMGLKNVWVMFPFVRTTWELEKAIKIMEEEGLRRDSDFKVWIMAEVPSVVVLAEEFAKIVDGFSVGSNDLAQLTLGVDRDSELLARMGYYDERDPAVLESIRKLIKAAHKYGKTVSICGQAPSVYPAVVEYLVKAGIDSISVNPDAVINVRRQVASIEQQIILRNLNGKRKNK